MIQLNENIVYIGIIDKKKCFIYFYLFDKNDYIFQFALKYYDEKTMYEEIKTKIKTKGIGLYLKEIKINSTINDIYNEKDDIIGSFINDYKQKYSNGIKREGNIGFINGILIGLINLEPIKKIFLDEKKISGMLSKNTKFTQYFNDLIKNLYSQEEEDKYKDNNDNKNMPNSPFIEEIQQKYQNDDIFKDIKVLTDFLLMKLHNEQKTDFDNKKYIYIETELSGQYNGRDLENFYRTNNSFIQENFFFEIENSYQCYFDYCKKYNQYYEIKCALFFNNLSFTSYKHKNDLITINDLLDTLNKDNRCPKCKTEIK
jgi:hypothetical protein